MTMVKNKSQRSIPRQEIRIVDPSTKVMDTVRTLAKENKRTLGKQAEYMLEQLIKNK